MMIHKRIREMTVGVRKFIFMKGGVGVLISLTYILQAIFLGKIITQLYNNKSIADMKYNLSILILMLVTRIVLVWINQVYGKWIVSRVKNRLRKRSYQKLMELGPGYMTNSRTGEIESTIIAGIDYLEGYLTLYIPQLKVCIVASGAIVIYVFTIHPVLGALALVTLVIALYSPMFFIAVLSKFTEEHWQAYMDLNAEFVDTTQGIITLKAFNASVRIGNMLKKDA